MPPPRFRLPTRADIENSFIAGHMTLVTRNLEDARDVGLTLFDPWR